MYIYIRTYTHVKKLFAKTQSVNLALTLQAHFLECRLTRFKKELFINRYIKLAMLREKGGTRNGVEPPLFRRDPWPSNK